ncbi:MAG: zinc ribbon domain-containing protein [Nitrospinota bacterium]|nr:zinc ribbon domain-containing protein [Nitrospinota bacterium]MDH5677189.1 zinc ribbon domain-containing protein [Nitrospinota bacterium]MDH5757875.1 zinc ribbon domain-containing protein [Nitrospinota bacterium]
MPIYEYECQKCGEMFEVNQRISDSPLKKHGNGSNCGGKVVKLMSANTFHLKGTGWYKTDYAKTTTAEKASSKKDTSDAASTSTAKDDSTKTETSAKTDSAEKKETPAKKESATATAE